MNPAILPLLLIDDDIGLPYSLSVIVGGRHPSLFLLVYPDEYLEPASSIDVIEPPGPVTLPPAIIPESIFAALKEKYNKSSLKHLYQSGFLPETVRADDWPYINLTKIYAVPYETNTCNVRVEEHSYQFTAYCGTFKDAKNIVRDIEEIYDYSHLNYFRRHSLFWNGSNIIEAEPGIYQSIVEYVILVERDTNLNTTIVEGLDLQECIKNKYNLPYDFKIGFSREGTQRPYINIPFFKTDDDEDTSKSRHEKMSFGFEIMAHTLEELEAINEEIVTLYDYSRLRFTGHKRFTTMEWEGDTITEMEPGFWQSIVNYSIIQEKDQ